MHTTASVDWAGVVLAMMIYFEVISDSVATVLITYDNQIGRVMKLEKLHAGF